MYNVFKKINSLLTLEFLKTNLGYDLKSIDPQKIFYRPSIEIGKIFRLCGLNYGKSADEIEMITSKIDKNDLISSSENNRCESFKLFYQKMMSYG